MLERRLTELFLALANRSICAGWLILALLVLRPLLKRGPKWLLPALWGVAGLRLVLPWSVESALSLIPSGETIPPDILLSPAPAIHSGIPALNSAVNPVVTEVFRPNPATSATPLQVWCFVAALVWLLGLCLLALYALVSTCLLRRRLGDAVLLRDRLYQSERVTSPFVFGLLRPRIYLPFHLPEADIPYIAAHEEAHIRRRDHWWKPLGFLLLAVYWMNPLVWLAYRCLCRDIELACDETVARSLGAVARADYSRVLLSCSVKPGMPSACPLAFGEAGVKERVRAVLRYRKPALWAVLAAGGLCVLAALCFLTNPPPPSDSVSHLGNSLWDNTSPEDGLPRLTREELVLLSQKGQDLTWTDFEKYAHRDVGSGLYIWKLEIDEMFYVLVGGSYPEMPPMYILLCARDGWDEDLEVREGGVADYILRHKDNPIAIDCADAWWVVSPLVPLPSELWIKMFGASGNEGQMAISSVQYLPVVRLDSRADLDDFLEELGPYIQVLRGTLGASEEIFGYFDEEFFEHHTLFAVYGEAAPDTMRVDHVRRWEDVLLTIGVSIGQPETEVPAVGQLLLVSVLTEDLVDVTRFYASVTARG